MFGPALGKAIIDAPRCVIAVDPGLSGAVWKMGRGRFLGLRDFKTMADIALAIRQLCTESPQPELAVIEQVHAFPGQGVCSMFSFGKATGFAEAAFALCLPEKVPAVAVAPQTWQKFVRKLDGLGENKAFDSRRVAIEMFPAFRGLFSRRKDHNSADAVLMAVWGQMQYQDSLRFASGNCSDHTEDEGSAPDTAECKTTSGL